MTESGSSIVASGSVLACAGPGRFPLDTANRFQQSGFHGAWSFQGQASLAGMGGSAAELSDAIPPLRGARGV